MPFSIFQIFDLKPKEALRISEKDLEKKFYELSRQFHPDRNLSDSDRATEQSSKLNEAYEVLKDPWKKASYLLDELNLERSKNLPTELAEIYFGLQEEDASREDLLQFLKILEMKRTAREKALTDFFLHFEGPFESQNGSLEQLKSWVAEEAYAKSMERDLRNKLTALSCGEIQAHD